MPPTADHLESKRIAGFLAANLLAVVSIGVLGMVALNLMMPFADIRSLGLPGWVFAGMMLFMFAAVAGMLSLILYLGLARQRKAPAGIHIAKHESDGRTGA